MDGWKEADCAFTCVRVRRYLGGTPIINRLLRCMVWETHQVLITILSTFWWWWCGMVVHTPPLFLVRAAVEQWEVARLLL